MARWLSISFIVTYLGALCFGVFAHAMNFYSHSHPLMYFIVWDMFCGWAAHEIRYHVIAEGESGRYYQVAPGPWKPFLPFDYELGRHHYDAYGNFQQKIAMNTLRHTDHEPINRIILVEENWPKKYNLPDRLCGSIIDRSPDFRPYYWARIIYDSEGNVVTRLPIWLHQVHLNNILDNPRLRADSARGRPVYAINPHLRTREYQSGDHQVSLPGSYGN